MEIGYTVKWNVDDARFTDCNEYVFHNVPEAIIGITLSVLARKDELMDEYKNDNTVYDPDLQTDVEISFEQWIAICIDNFCHFEKDWFHDVNFHVFK